MTVIKVIKLVMITLVIAFMVTYIIGESGYYEYQLSSRKNLTEEQIQKFEEDVKNGVEIDLNEYLQNERIDYSSPFSRTTYKVSTKLNNYLKSGIETAFKLISKMVEE